MDGIHDLGGRQGFGRVRHSPTRRPSTAIGRSASTRSIRSRSRLGIFNMDEYRHAIERMEPRHYVSASYYERSLTSLATLSSRRAWSARRARAARERRVSAGVAERAGPHQRRRRASAFGSATRSSCAPTTFPGTSACRPTSAASAASSSASRPPYPFPDAHAHGVAAADEPTYDVRFSSAELWPNSRRHGVRPRRRVPELPGRARLTASDPAARIAPSVRRRAPPTHAQLHYFPGNASRSSHIVPPRRSACRSAEVRRSRVVGAQVGRVPGDQSERPDSGPRRRCAAARHGAPLVLDDDLAAICLHLPTAIRPRAAAARDARARPCATMARVVDTSRCRRAITHYFYPERWACRSLPGAAVVKALAETKSARCSTSSTPSSRATADRGCSATASASAIPTRSSLSLDARLRAAPRASCRTSSRGSIACWRGHACSAPSLARQAGRAFV